MKKIILIILIISALSEISAQEWKLKTNLTTNALFDIFFVNKMNGWIVGENGIVLRTSNGGDTWIGQKSNTTVSLRSVFFVDSLNGYVVGSDGKIIKSTDGGANWEIQASGTKFYLFNVFFISKEIGWVVGGNTFNGTIMKTTDSGMTWEKMIDSTAGSFQAVYFIDEKEGWVVGGESFFDNLKRHKILHTTDDGNSWQDFSDHSKLGPLVDVRFLNKQFGWASGFSPSGWGILKTTNKGLIWENSRIQHGDLAWGDYYKSIAAVDLDNIWVASLDTIYQSSDSGISWNANSRDSKTSIGSINFIDKNTGWAVGSNGSIWKYDGNIVSVWDDKIKSNKNSILENSFPNPANPTTHIKYFVANESYVRLKIYNLLGAEVKTLVNEYKLSGNYEVVFDGSKFSSGVYYYSIIIGSYTKTKQLILIK